MLFKEEKPSIESRTINKIIDKTDIINSGMSKRCKCIITGMKYE